MRRVLVVVTDLEVGGTARHLVEVLPRLGKRGLQLSVYPLAAGGPLSARLAAAGVEVLTPPAAPPASEARRLRGLLALPAAVGGLWWTIRRRRPDIVHSFLPAAYLVGGLVSLVERAPLYVMSRRSLNRYQRKHPVLTRLERRLHRRMAAALGNSRAVAAELGAEGVPPDRLGLIYNGVEVSALGTAPSPAEARARLGLGPAPLVLTTVASLLPYKGHGDLLEALARIRDALPDPWILLCVGRDGGLGPALAARAAALGLEDRVRWLGEREDVPEILRASDLGILCSHEEGFPNSVLEGMAAGLPMIVTDAGGTPEAVTDGVSGRVVPVGVPEALGAAVLELARDPARRRALGDAGRRRVAAEFSLDASVERYERLYTGLGTTAGRPVSAILDGEPGP